MYIYSVDLSGGLKVANDHSEARYVCIYLPTYLIWKYPQLSRWIVNHLLTNKLALGLSICGPPVDPNFLGLNHLEPDPSRVSHQKRLRIKTKLLKQNDFSVFQTSDTKRQKKKNNMKVEKRTTEPHETLNLQYIMAIEPDQNRINSH